MKDTIITSVDSAVALAGIIKNFADSKLFEIDMTQSKFDIRRLKENNIYRASNGVVLVLQSRRSLMNGDIEKIVVVTDKLEVVWNSGESLIDLIGTIITATKIVDTGDLVTAKVSEVAYAIFELYEKACKVREDNINLVDNDNDGSEDHD